jgi:hypothetical protein
MHSGECFLLSNGHDGTRTPQTPQSQLFEGCTTRAAGTGSTIELGGIQRDSDASATVSELFGLSGQSKENLFFVQARTDAAGFEKVSGQTVCRVEITDEDALKGRVRLLFK